MSSKIATEWFGDLDLVNKSAKINFESLLTPFKVLCEALGAVATIDFSLKSNNHISTFIQILETHGRNYE